MSDKQNYDPRFSVHIIGGRAETGAFPYHSFAGDVVNVIYDADAECLEQIEEKSRGQASRSIVLPYCLGGARGKRFFNLNYDPYTSSLLDMNPRYADFYMDIGEHDYPFSETLRAVRRVETEVMSIDDIYSKDAREIDAPPPDFLNIDTQGSEYEILQGAAKTIGSSVVGAVMEVEFEPIYEGQKLFGDLLRLMSEMGFYFVKFLHVPNAAPSRYPIGLRQDGFMLYSDALFLRKTSGIEQRIENSFRRYFMLRKLAFASILHGQLEYGLKALETAAPCETQETRGASEGMAYQAFLSKLLEETARHPKVFPPTFADVYRSFDESQGRFMTERQLADRKTVEGNRTEKASSLAIADIEKLATDTTPFEAVLKEYGLYAHAESVRRRRLASMIRSENGESWLCDPATGAKIRHCENPLEAPAAARRRLYKARSVAVFGASAGARKILPGLRSIGMDVRYITDNNETTHGKPFEGMIVTPPAKVDWSAVDFTIVASSYGYPAISKQLAAMGFREGEDFVGFTLLTELLGGAA